MYLNYISSASEAAPGIEMDDYSIIHSWVFKAKTAEPVDFRYRHNGDATAVLALWQAKAVSI